ncbi:hypothetical protein H8959_002793 [Pygathrix nigripes]
MVCYHRSVLGKTRSSGNKSRLACSEVWVCVAFHSRGISRKSHAHVSIESLQGKFWARVLLWLTHQKRLLSPRPGFGCTLGQRNLIAWKNILKKKAWINENDNGKTLDISEKGLKQLFCGSWSNLYSIMSPRSQTTENHQSFFTLTGIPGMPEKDLWMALPLCLLYSTTILGNVTILVVLKVEQSLHEPMYYFLAMLAATDLSLSLSSMPTMVSVHWFNWYSITFSGCLIQMFFIHTFRGAESGVLMAMAFDRSVAIGFPLHYATILTHSVISKTAAAVLLRSCPLPCNCLHQDAMRLACADTSVNSIYGLLAVIFIIVLDALILLASYIPILHAVLNIASQEERLKALNTCLSHICAVLLFYVPLMCMTLIHRYGKHLSPLIHTFMANIYLLFPPVLNLIVYSVTTKQLRWRIVQAFCGARVSP